MLLSGSGSNCSRWIGGGEGAVLYCILGLFNSSYYIYTEYLNRSNCIHLRFAVLSTML